MKETMASIRRRTRVNETPIDGGDVEVSGLLLANQTLSNYSQQGAPKVYLCGVTLAVLVSGLWCWIVSTIHENTLWFSRISDIEREISFRSENGFYYFFYKQFIQSNTTSTAVEELVRDNNTEYGRTINVLARFNVYQEVLTGLVYRVFSITYNPAMFYVNVIFALQFISIFAVFLTSWLLSGSLIGPLLTSSYLVLNMNDVTRVDNSAPLRENWAMPFLHLQSLISCIILNKTKIKFLPTKGSFLVHFICGLCFSLFWQFNQYVFLLQSVSLYGCAALRLTPKYETKWLLLSNFIALGCCAILQFFNQMILCSLTMSFIPCAIVALWSLNRSYSKCSGFRYLCNVIFVSIIVLLAALITSTFLKWLLNIDDDKHILKFLANKLNESDPTFRDFDTSLYLCLNVFQHMSGRYLLALCLNGPLIPYAVVCTVTISYGLYVTFRSKTISEAALDEFWMERAGVFFYTSQSLAFSILAVAIMRFKLIWLPMTCVLAGMVTADLDIYKTIQHYTKVPGLFVRVSILGLLSSSLMYQSYPTLARKLTQLSEFHDPDTVALVKGLDRLTNQNAVFTATMQVCSLVRLGAGRAITNHPHYENQWLRKRTVHAYQIYSRLPGNELHQTLRSIGTTHIIVENSVCFQRARPADPHCTTKAIIDTHNAHLPEGTGTASHLPGTTPARQTQQPRFCSHIAEQPAHYAHMFKLILENHTFRVYQLL